MNISQKEEKLNSILEKALQGKEISGTEVIYLLSLQDESEINRLFSTAQLLRARSFSNKIFLYGFIYFSNYCRNDCTFCYYRCSNSLVERYRKKTDEILATAEQLAASGVHLIDLTMGEDPHFFNEESFESLIEITGKVRETTGLPVMISPGVIPRKVLEEFKRIGVDWYACYQETHNRDLFRTLRLGQNYDMRLDLKKYAHELGLLTEEGLLVGLGETAEDLLHSFRVMRDLSADQIRVMSFVPQKGTPLEERDVESRLREMLVIAVMRLLFPDRLIPASLDVDGIAGLKKRLNAGANVITSIIPPGRGLMGVSQSTLDIGEGGRTVKGVLPILAECGLEAAAVDSYSEWIDDRRFEVKKSTDLIMER